MTQHNHTLCYDTGYFKEKLTLIIIITPSITTKKLTLSIIIHLLSIVILSAVVPSVVMPEVVALS